MMTALRRSFGLRVFAGLFALLIALPFTAPFRVWDSGAPFGKAPIDDLKASDDLSNSAAIASGVAGAAPVLAASLDLDRTPGGRAVRRPILLLVLRL